MSFFGNFVFFVWLFPFVVLAIVLGLLQKPLKTYGFLVSIFFIGLIVGPDKKQLLFLAVFYVLEFSLVKGYSKLRAKYGRNGKIYGCFVLASILPVILSKCSEVSSMSVFQFLGISYLTFRIVQIIIEMYDGVIKDIKTMEFTSFLLFFPTLSSGPIDRSRRFLQDWNKTYTRAEYLELLGDGLHKIVLGIAYKFVFAALFYKLMGMFAGYMSLAPLIVYSYGYGFYMFFDFAGYSLMAIGVSYLFGIKTPENFNKPFISKDIKDFWNRWHMTLSYWFRDFIFTRFMMKSIKEKWFSTRLKGATAGFIVNMFIMGAWHGFSLHYLIYGLYHGCLLALTEIYQKKSKLYAKYKNRKWYRGVSWFVTINLVMLGFLIFSGDVIK